MDTASAFVYLDTCPPCTKTGPPHCCDDPALPILSSSPDRLALASSILVEIYRRSPTVRPLYPAVLWDFCGVGTPCFFKFIIRYLMAKSKGNARVPIGIAILRWWKFKNALLFLCRALSATIPDSKFDDLRGVI